MNILNNCLMGSCLLSSLLLASTGFRTIDRVGSTEVIAANAKHCIEGTISNSSDEVISVEIRDSNDLLKDHFGTITSPTGNYAVSMFGRMDGTYDLYIKGRNSLRKRITVAFTKSGVAGVNFALTLGDVNNDNNVNSKDLSLITNAIGITSADLEWHSRVNDTVLITAQIADFNGDNQVTSADYNIAYANQGSGD